MIGLDTNVLVRFLVNDDPVQSQQAREFMQHHCTETSPCHIGVIVLCELVWVLSRAYGRDKTEIHAVLEKLLQTSRLQVESPEVVRAAMHECEESGAELPDSLIGKRHQHAGCSHTVTFDHRAARLKSFRTLPPGT